MAGRNATSNAGPTLTVGSIALQPFCRMNAVPPLLAAAAQLPSRPAAAAWCDTSGLGRSIAIQFLCHPVSDGRTQGKGQLALSREAACQACVAGLIAREQMPNDIHRTLHVSAIIKATFAPIAQVHKLAPPSACTWRSACQPDASPPHFKALLSPHPLACEAPTAPQRPHQSHWPPLFDFLAFSLRAGP